MKSYGYCTMNKHKAFLFLTLLFYVALTVVFFLGFFFIWFVSLRVPELNVFLWSNSGRFMLASFVLLVPCISFINVYYGKGEINEKCIKS